MKVVHIWQHYSPNLFDMSHPLCLFEGIESNLICQYFSDNGSKPLKNTLIFERVDPESINSVTFLERLRRFMRRKFENPRFVEYSLSKISKIDPDIIHFHFGTTAALFELEKKLPSSPIIVSFYGVDISQSLKDIRILKSYKKIFKKGLIFHVLCEEAKTRLVSIGCPEGKIRIQNLPVDLNNIPFIGSHLSNKTRFLIPARFVEKKGHIILLQAFKKLVDEGLSVELTCFGYGPTSWLKDEIRKHDLDGYVRLINNNQTDNFLEEYLSVLRSHDVILAPSVTASSGDDEGGPALTVIMAQAAGKPVVLSNFPGSERSVTNLKEGLIVKENSVVELTEAMSRLVGNASEWDRLGKAGSLRVRNEFSKESYWNSLDEWYEYCLRSNKGYIKG